MQTTETLFERELVKLINERIDFLGGEVSSGAIEDIATYKSKTGMIEGLKAALEFMPVARVQAEQRNR